MHRLQSVWTWFALPALAVVWLTSSVAAQAPTEAAPGPDYERAVQQALVEFEAGRWEPALSLFAQADHIFPSARTKRGMGLVMFEMGKYPEAVSYLALAIASPVRPLTPELRAQAESLIKNAKQHYATLIVDVVPMDATTLIDGRPRAGMGRQYVNLTPGPHAVEVRATGYDSRSYNMNLPPGSEQTLRVELAQQAAVAETPIGGVPPKTSIQLRLRSRQEGMKFWLEDFESPNGWRLLCGAPCETNLDLGTHTLGLSLDDEDPVSVGHATPLLTDQTVVGTLTDYPGSGVFETFTYLGAGMVVVAGLLAGSALLSSDSGTQTGLVASGGIIGLVGGIFVLTSLTSGNQPDYMASITTQ